MLALGVYLAVTLLSARKRRDEAPTLLIEGIDLSETHCELRRAKILAVRETFELVARDWLRKIATIRSVSTQEKSRLAREQYFSPSLGDDQSPSSNRATCCPLSENGGP